MRCQIHPHRDTDPAVTALETKVRGALGFTIEVEDPEFLPQAALMVEGVRPGWKWHVVQYQELGGAMEVLEVRAAAPPRLEQGHWTIRVTVRNDDNGNWIHSDRNLKVSRIAGFTMGTDSPTASETPPESEVSEPKKVVWLPRDHPWMPWLQHTHNAAAFEHKPGCACPDGVVTVQLSVGAPRAESLARLLLRLGEGARVAVVENPTSGFFTSGDFDEFQMPLAGLGEEMTTLADSILARYEDKSVGAGSATVTTPVC